MYIFSSYLANLVTLGLLVFGWFVGFCYKPYIRKAVKHCAHCASPLLLSLLVKLGEACNDQCLSLGVKPVLHHYRDVEFHLLEKVLPSFRQK